MSLENYPLPPDQNLKAQFVGTNLQDVPVPSAILDLGIVKKNCKRMLDAVAELQVSFRAHVKTHKTSELTRLQVGVDSKDVRVIVSTVVEAESLLPLMQEYQAKGARVSILYGVPLGKSHVTRLAAVAKKLGPGTIATMIDNVAQLSSVKQFNIEAGSPISIFIKTDSGYHRAGLLPQSSAMIDLVKKVSEAESQGELELLGFYSHNSLSYGGNSPDQAMDMLKVEIDVCHEAAQHLLQNQFSRKQPLIISVGASPTALSINNLLPRSSSNDSASASALLQSLTQTRTSTTFELEIHAGVYPVFDLQQVAASSIPFPDLESAHAAIALTILTEVISTHPDRTSTPEAIVNAGCLALAREPCKSYAGWGVVSSWNMSSTSTSSHYDEHAAVDSKSRIIVSRISQEHGILGRENTEEKNELPLVYGQKLRIWPNHACITGAGFGWYLIVNTEETGDEVVDVWVRWKGW